MSSDERGRILNGIFKDRHKTGYDPKCTDLMSQVVICQFILKGKTLITGSIIKEPSLGNVMIIQARYYLATNEIKYRGKSCSHISLYMYL